MIRFIIQRLLQLIPAILISSFIIFFAMNLTGGDPAMIIAGDKASAERIEQVRENTVLTSCSVQYIRYMAGLVRAIWEFPVLQIKCFNHLWLDCPLRWSWLLLRFLLYCYLFLRNIHSNKSKYMEG